MLPQNAVKMNSFFLIDCVIAMFVSAIMHTTYRCRLFERRKTMTIRGIHHITIVCADAQRTVNFYTQVLGMRFIKKTVNFDDPSSYHLYFGNETATPGSFITFFECPDASKGYPGIGGTHHFAL